MLYPEFYQAWRQSPEVGANPEALRLNLTNLPQNFHIHITNEPELHQTVNLICIDASLFVDKDNPAQKIYTQMVKGGCPKSSEGILKTIVELQTYWDLLESDRSPRIANLVKNGVEVVHPYLYHGIRNKRELYILSRH